MKPTNSAITEVTKVVDVCELGEGGEYYMIPMRGGDRQLLTFQPLIEGSRAADTKIHTTPNQLLCTIRNELEKPCGTDWCHDDPKSRLAKVAVNRAIGHLNQPPDNRPIFPAEFKAGIASIIVFLAIIEDGLGGSKGTRDSKVELAFREVVSAIDALWEKAKDMADAKAGNGRGYDPARHPALPPNGPVRAE